VNPDCNIQIFGYISFSTLVAPVLGGFLYEKAGIAGVFSLAFALLLVDFSMRLLVIEVKVAQQYRAAEPSEAPDYGHLDPRSSDDEGNHETSPLLEAATAKSQQHVLPKILSTIVRKAPILACFRDLSFLASLLVGFVQGVLLGSLDGTVPIISRHWYGFSSFNAGLMFLPIGMASLSLGPIFGKCVDRYGTKTVAVLLYAYLVPVLVMFQMLRPGDAYNAAGYGALLGFIGAGLAGTGAPSVVEASTIVHKYWEANPDVFEDNGPFAQLYAITNCCFSLGLALGPELAGTLTIAVGYGNMNVVLAVLCALTAVLSFFFLGHARP
jgi:MFS family permease